MAINRNAIGSIYKMNNIAHVFPLVNSVMASDFFWLP